MNRTQLYAVIYVLLFALATAQVLVEQVIDPEQAYLLVLVVILSLSLAKAAMVAGFYQHLRWEPRSLTYVLLLGLLAAVALTAAASYSIT